jgi:hypothetical protein
VWRLIRSDPGPTPKYLPACETLTSGFVGSCEATTGRNGAGGGYRELRKRGLSRHLAWNVFKPAHGLRRLSQGPALAIALPEQYFAALGLPNVVER